MRAGPAPMYASQSTAFQARDRAVRPPTSSTPDSPPRWHAPDLEGLCRRKRQVLSNLPKNCVHCGAKYPSNSEIKGTFVELKDGTIMAYCKATGGCGKSHVLFAGVKLVAPRYEKVCPFVSRIEARSMNEVDLQSDGAHAECQVVEAEPMVAEASAESVVTSIAIADVGAPSTVVADLQVMEGQLLECGTSISPVAAQLHSDDDLHELHNPTCTSCGNRYVDHHHDCDINGWRQCGEEAIAPPEGWPVYCPQTCTWSEVDSISGTQKSCVVS